MRVSVIVAAYNIEKYIERCIKSIVNQSLSDIEIIVVNDGSTDKTLDRLNNLKICDTRIKVVSQNNKGLIEARKEGFNNAVGEYILFIDGDDFLEINALKEAYDYGINNKLDIVCFNAYKSYDNYKEEFHIFNNNEFILKEPLKGLFLDNMMPAIWAKMVRRNFIINNEIKFPSDISYGEDLATVAHWFMYNPKIGLLNRSLYNYYQRTDSITGSISNKILDVNVAIEFIKDELINNDIYYLYNSEFEYMVFIHLFKRVIIDSKTLNDITKEVYVQYKERNINIHRNKYISNYVKEQPLSMKIRIIAYNFNYDLGKAYDLIRFKIKKLLCR